MCRKCLQLPLLNSRCLELPNPNSDSPQQPQLSDYEYVTPIDLALPLNAGQIGVKNAADLRVCSIMQATRNIMKTLHQLQRLFPVALSSIALFLGGTLHAQDTTYEFVASTANPFHYAATIVMDSPINSVGSYDPADVVSFSFSNDLGSVSANGFEEITAVDRLV